MMQRILSDLEDEIDFDKTKKNVWVYTKSEKVVEVIKKAGIIHGN